MDSALATLRARLDDIRDERHFPAHMLDVHDEMMATLNKMESAFETLAFIEGYSSMPSDKWHARFSEWCALMDKARTRFREETDHGRRGWAKSDVLVSSEDCAIHHWVFLPLIRAVLDAKTP